MNMPYQATVRPIAPQDAVAKIADNQAILIDVREHSELAITGTALGALHIPLMTIPAKTDPQHPKFHKDLKTDRPVIVFCAMGGRAEKAAQALLAFGFSEVYNLGGLQHWQQGGGEIIPA